MPDEAIELPAEFLRATLAAAQAIGCQVHEETNWEGFSRFVIILPDTRLISQSQWRPRPEALLAALRGAAPYIHKISAEIAEEHRWEAARRSGKRLA